MDSYISVLCSFGTNDVIMSCLKTFPNVLQGQDARKSFFLSFLSLLQNFYIYFGLRRESQVLINKHQFWSSLLSFFVLVYHHGRCQPTQTRGITGAKH